MEQQLTHGSLFSGIGGFDLAAEWMGWQNIFHCEWNPFGQTILKHYWPNATSYNDITKTDFSIHRGTIDVLTGGFPCQPYSMAGKRLGKEDDRHLWPEMLRAIREIQPQWVVGENVFGLTNWNGGLVFNEVQVDLETEGYEVQAYVLPACAVNAIHRRDRVWFVAHSNSSSTQSPRQGTRVNRKGSRDHDEQGEWGKQAEFSTGWRDVLPDERALPNTSSFRQPGQGRAFNASNKTEGSNRKEHRTFNALRWPTQPPIFNGDDGFPGRLDGITLSDWQKESIKAGGNAIVPQVAYQIFQAISQLTKAA